MRRNSPPPPLLLLRIIAFLSTTISFSVAANTTATNTTCPYDIPAAVGLIPPSCYANYTGTDVSTSCCTFVFAAFLFSAIRYSNVSGAAFLPAGTSAACSNAFASYLLQQRLVPSPLLLSGNRCNLNANDPSQFAANNRPCQYPLVSAIRSAVNLSSAVRLCTSSSHDLLSNPPSCTSCQNAVIASTLSLLNYTKSKEFVPCGMATTIGIWSSSPNLTKFRSYALCMVQVLDNVGNLGTSNLMPGPPPPPPPPSASTTTPLPPPQLKSPRKTPSASAATVAATSAAAGLLSVVIVFAVFFLIRRRIRLGRKFNGERSTSAGGRTVTVTTTLPTEGLYIFTKSELKQATNGFDLSLLLGEGGAGKVYLGKLPSGQHVAIKRIQQRKKIDEFYREVQILARLRHRNLTTLVGYCIQKRERALVYEYMAGGNLARALHEGELTWRRRLEIAADVAEGLAYLHELPEGAIIHRDVKQTNVLLAESGLAKLSDFGVSKVLPMEVSHVSTAVIKGTRGYVDPESYFEGHVSEATDVYSFGIVLLELVSGRKAVVSTPSGGAESIVYSAHELVVSGGEGEPDVRKIADQRLGKVAVEDGTVAEVFKVAYRCVRPFKNERPRMKQVLEVLKTVMVNVKEEVDLAVGHSTLVDNVTSSDEMILHGFTSSSSLNMSLSAA